MRYILIPLLLYAGWAAWQRIEQVNALVATPTPPIVRATKYEAWNCVYGPAKRPPKRVKRAPKARRLP